MYSCEAFYRRAIPLSVSRKMVGLLLGYTEAILCASLLDTTSDSYGGSETVNTDPPKASVTNATGTVR